MTLEQYKNKFGTTYAHIARNCGVTQAAISSIATGSKRPSYELAIQIEDITRGLVPRTNWYAPRSPDITVTIGRLTA
jgi:DNA-binding XRE family transcriptional regulator